MDNLVKVKFKGHEYWAEANFAEPGADTPLAKLHHCNENGELLWEHVFSDSFAHLGSDGIIRRYHEEIGKREDLQAA